MAKVKEDHDGGGVTFGGAHYTCTLGPIHSLDMDEDGLRISFGWEPSWTCNDCPHGHPHEVPGDERVARTVEEAVASGWLAKD